MLLLLATVMLTATPNTEGPVAEALQRVWRPLSDAQAVAFASTAPELCYSGRKFGLKSNTLGAKAAVYANRYGPNNGYPPARVILCREERAAMEQTMLVTMRDEILGPELHAALYNTKDDGLVFPNRSVILYRGLDKPERIQGMRYGLAGCDQAEQLSEDQFTILDAGCTQVGMPWTQTMLAFNPDSPGHWAYLRYRPDEGDGPRYWEDGKHFADVVHVKVNDGLEILSPQQRDKLDRMTGTWAQRLRWGKWIGFEGQVLDNFDPAIHVRPAPDSWAEWDGLPPPSWTRYRGVDFGFVHPWACVWLVRAPGGNLMVYRYAMRVGLTIEDQCTIIKAAEADELARLRRCASAEYARENASTLDRLNLARSFSDHEAGHRAQYQANGVWTELAKKDVLAGIETLRDLFDPRDVDAEGYPRLCIIRGALMERDRKLEAEKRPTSLEEEISRWNWRTAKTAGGARVTKDQPVDIGEDAIAALRYVCHSLEMQGSIGIY